MRTIIHLALTLSLLASAASGFATAQEAGIAPNLHPWGRFSPGAWKYVRVVTETFDENGKLVNTTITETKTTLLNVEKDGVTLQIEVVLWVAGKRMDAQPQTIKQGYYGELENHKIEIKDLKPGEVVIDGEHIACKIRQVKLFDESGDTTTTFHYSDHVAPFILKRESVTTSRQKNPDSQKNPGSPKNLDSVSSETKMVVDALRMPCEVMGGIKTAAHVKAIHKHPGGTTTTLAYTSIDVPGGIVRNTSKEVDNSGRLVRRSVLELIDCGLEPESKRTGLFHRRIRPRLRKSFRDLPE